MQGPLKTVCRTDVSELVLSFPTGNCAAVSVLQGGKSIPAKGPQQYFNELHPLESCGEPFHANVLLFEWTAAVVTKARPREKADPGLRVLDRPSVPHPGCLCGGRWPFTTPACC